MQYVVHVVSNVSLSRTVISRFPDKDHVTNHVGGGGYHGDNSRQEIMTVGPESPTETALIATVAVKYLKVQKSDSHDTLKILNALKVTS